MEVVIIDDEKKGRDVLKKLLTLINLPVTVIGEADSVESGKQLLLNVEPDILFLDIRMADGTGFSLLDQLKNISFSIVFTTAYDEYAIKAFKYNAIDYLLKPIDLEELMLTIENIKEKSSQNVSNEAFNIKQLLNSITKRKIAITSVNETVFISEDDIFRCEGENNYTHIYLSSGKKITSTKTLKSFENKLNQNKFHRIHNSHIININFIEKINSKGQVVMIDETEIEISRRRKKRFLEFFDKI